MPEEIMNEEAWVERRSIVLNSTHNTVMQVLESAQISFGESVALLESVKMEIFDLYRAKE